MIMDLLKRLYIVRERRFGFYSTSGDGDVDSAIGRPRRSICYCEDVHVHMYRVGSSVIPSLGKCLQATYQLTSLYLVAGWGGAGEGLMHPAMSRVIASLPFRFLLFIVSQVPITLRHSPSRTEKQPGLPCGQETQLVQLQILS